MAKHHRSLFVRLSQFRLFIRKLIITLVAIGAFGLVFLNKIGNKNFDKNQDIVSRVLYPVVRILQLPADGVYLAYVKIKDVFLVYDENNLLKKKAQKLDKLQNKLYALQAENKLLSEMLYYTPPSEASFVTAKIIASEGDGFSHSLVAYVPENKEIKKGQVATFKDALIGRVDRVSGPYVRIMLVSDISSKIPVLLERTRDNGILSGNNTQVLHLLYMPSNVEVLRGDRVVTSGIGGIFPSELLVGYVRKASNTVIEVVPAHDLDKIEYVKIIRYWAEDDIFDEDEKK